MVHRDGETLGGTPVFNRVVLTAMVTNASGEDGYVNQALIDRYVRFAHGEVGLVVVEARPAPRRRQCVPGRRGQGVPDGARATAVVSTGKIPTPSHAEAMLQGAGRT